MGNENSSLVDDSTPPETLESRTLEGVAKYIKKKNVRHIVVLTGAGISTAAGIPDFRSPDTGLYANLGRLNLPDPEAVFDISYFRKNPLPFYALAKEMFPGKYRPTLTHSFIKLLYDKGRLLKLFTQNIDCLEREAGVPGEMIVEAHGSFASHRCIDCKVSYPDELMRKSIAADDVPLCPECMGLVKPDIVFFGEALPESFFMNRTLIAAADLCIIMGTSLSVQPFASLPSLCNEGVPRLLINMDRVGGLGSRLDDVLLLGECDAGVLKLADALGWREELEELWARTNPENAAALKKGKMEEKETAAKSRDELLRDEVDKLTEEVENTLHLSKSHEMRVREELEAKEGEEKKVDDTHVEAKDVPVVEPDQNSPTPSSTEDEGQTTKKASETSVSEDSGSEEVQDKADAKPDDDDINAAKQEASPSQEPKSDTGQDTGPEKK
ncbi:Sir2 histone deacetylase Hst2 [Onygenales sp. PD_12]|nr:Sir2 histone deacetylase Hst2 [Onygenales sp. PD_12]